MKKYLEGLRLEPERERTLEYNECNLKVKILQLIFGNSSTRYSKCYLYVSGYFERFLILRNRMKMNTF